jgi:hypothetical protein
MKKCCVYNSTTTITAVTTAIAIISTLAFVIKSTIF